MTFLNEEITLYYENKERVTYNNLFDLHKAAPSDVLSVCKSMPIFPLGILLQPKPGVQTVREEIGRILHFIIRSVSDIFGDFVV